MLCEAKVCRSSSYNSDGADDGRLQAPAGRAMPETDPLARVPGPWGRCCHHRAAHCAAYNPLGPDR